MDVRPARPDDVDALAALAEDLQRRPDRHVAYLSTDASAIAADLEAEDGWTAVSAVADGPGGPVAWLVGEVDPELGRVWWWGPFVSGGAVGRWADGASALLDHAIARLPPGIDQEEFAIDERFVELHRWAVGRGFDPDPASAILALPLDRTGPETPPHDRPGAGLTIRPAAADDRATVAPLHDRLFPGTHTVGAALLDDAENRFNLVAEADGRPIGYVAVERNADDEAYIDFIGVDPHQRLRGVGRALVTAAVAEGRRMGCARAALTVRTDNPAARALYRSLGFTEERILEPLRKGFRIP